MFLGPRPTVMSSLPSPDSTSPENCNSNAVVPIAVSYVTKSYLQQRYPPASDHSAAEVTTGKGRYGARQYATAASDVNLSPECFASQPRVALRDPSFLRIVFVGTLESLYKGPDVLLEAVAICKNQGIPFKVRFMGIGQQMTALRKQCLRLGIDNEVEFLGSVTAGEPVRRELDRADLFVLPSRAEGVPRAMLEAMARGLPCIGSSIGGIPELLHEEDLVPADNPAALAKVIGTVFADQLAAGENVCSQLTKGSRIFYRAAFTTKAEVLSRSERAYQERLLGKSTRPISKLSQQRRDLISDTPCAP